MDPREGGVKKLGRPRPAEITATCARLEAKARSVDNAAQVAAPRELCGLSAEFERRLVALQR